ncbi:exported protein of unknown function [Candidatus Filomicrobium marinum]|uniref:Uncharacterized protein n=2 Tax=Filomicrobium TaxID=119044 RepID=A0A0D6JLD3_9HYPH|nr:MULTISPECIES: hypothetical protein [Filomicrobium]MCV0369124.1 hypothetical protein [Filomicrobium sp.]CFX61051.1 exported protein of unknown function [Candidatus Filomicrobium marinum]CPR22445.1 exported protein of unknown function [Candidatus Filomicrobium marinum]SDO84338.1 hypothetical protein SAMN04488061_1799 [Filomicrobium insigne]
MKTIMKFFGVAALALSMPFMAGQASAAEARIDAPVQQSLTGNATHNKGMIVAKSDASGEKIVVAGRRGRWVGPAIVGGVALGLALGAANRAHAHDHRHYRGRYDRCDRWAHRCRRGNDNACYKLDRYCY